MDIKINTEMKIHCSFSVKQTLACINFTHITILWYSGVILHQTQDYVTILTLKCYEGVNRVTWVKLNIIFKIYGVDLGGVGDV